MKVQCVVLLILVAFAAAQVPSVDRCYDEIKSSITTIKKLKALDTKSILFVVKAVSQMKKLSTEFKSGIEACKHIKKSQVSQKLEGANIPLAKCILDSFVLFGDVSNFALAIVEKKVEKATVDAVVAAKQLFTTIEDCQQV